MKLSARDKQVFSAVMTLYCNGEGLPVASSKIAKMKGMAICSATVRNAMARLENQGLLFSPHTSAGRVPSDIGIKYWLQEYFELDTIATYWQPEQEQLVTLAHSLSQHYQVCCVVGLPQVSSQKVFRVEVLDFDRKHWLVLLIDKAGQSQNICINKPADNSDEIRYQFALWMNTVFSQQTLKEGLHRMRAMANSAMPNCRELLSQWTRELSLQLGTDNSIVVGERHIYNRLEQGNDVSLGVPFLHQVEDKLAFRDGLSVLLGSDIDADSLSRYVILSVPYFMDQEYQSRFCVVCPSEAPIESIIDEFSRIEQKDS
ncbi:MULTISPECIES: transcriptional regulator [Pseudoalteromonas]|uniref:Heat-inducible transcription repressor HrcA n=2 Tax=Pseudoalteromonas TaxID=53246 RepID=V4HQV6_PSEL2|nr:MULTISPECIES: transcriptional regulator [Pseudoalteromonas]ESP90289.1 transcriptional regulator [Pseudoalteromonas luteoviolacea 2ta16]KZN39934.1 HrcA family transcriptional regulator [Pseudoalteromonas luteoviolacea NCIMB 1944]MBQ4835353.1 HrcA family transcriptional regulator [Pseudoalteromonas luteoviolacea]MCG7546993.1 HrcA family transcriptional regulator [Pseudoalteromonas sp. Of7M-16]MDK2598003.1 HrcA family transcriptional regulator [Pseudoalteromonas sp. P94(2023)]